MDEKKQFRQWEGRVFGAGYGTGELPILKAVKIFFDNLEDKMYSYEKLEFILGDTVTWLLINAFDKGNMIEWGTSSRFGWITSCGEYVRSFIEDKTPDELYDIIMNHDEDDFVCECDGTMKGEGHEFCDKNPMINKRYADKLKYK